MKKLLLMLMLLIVGVFSVSTAQDFPPKMREKMRQLMVWKLTDRLNLSKEQSEKFYPLLNEMMNANEKLIDEKRQLIREISSDQNKLTDSELNDKSTRLLVIDKERAENLIKLSKNCENILSAKQRADMIIIQTEFVRDIAKLIEKQRKERKNKSSEDDSKSE